MKTISRFVRSSLLAVSILSAARSEAEPLAVASLHKNSDGLTLKLSSGTLKLQVFSPRVIRVTYWPGNSQPSGTSLSVIARPARTRWKSAETRDEVRLTTDEIEARVNRTTGAIGFYDKSGKDLLPEEPGGGKSLTTNRVANLDTLQSRQVFELPPDEAIYGLGQHQQGLMNYRVATVHLQQKNMDVAVPVLVSSRGYGVLWDNPAVTDIKVGAGDDAGLLSWNSEAADAIDYYFLYGPELDQVIGAYRQLTGVAPIFGSGLLCGSAAFMPLQRPDFSQLEAG